MITKEDLKNDLIRVKKEKNLIPSSRRYLREGRHSLAAVNKKFGSWNNALLEVFGGYAQKIRIPKRIVKCPNCGKDTENPKFCSPSCAATYNNKIYKRKYPIKYCKADNCGKEIKGKTGYCKEHIKKFTLDQYAERTIGSFVLTYSKNRYQNIRNHAHSVADYYSLPKMCPYCDYKNHFDLCHIKSIGDFDWDTKLFVVNHIDNLIHLCKNHHWELDNGMLDIKK